MNDIAKLIVGIVFGFFALLLLLFPGGGGMFGMGPMMGGFGFRPLFMVFVWSVVIALKVGACCLGRQPEPMLVSELD